MTLDHVVLTLKKHVRKSHMPTMKTIIALWDSLELTKEDSARLAQEALAARVNRALTSVTIEARAKDNEEEEGSTEVSVIVLEAPPSERYEVTVQILADVSYDIEGVRKPVSQFGVHDVSVLHDQTTAVIDSGLRYDNLWLYIDKTLRKFGKNTVGELTDGEQLTIARMLFDVKKTGTDPLDHSGDAVELTKSLVERKAIGPSKPIKQASTASKLKKKKSKAQKAKAA